MKRNIKNEELITILIIIAIGFVTFSITQRNESELFRNNFTNKSSFTAKEDPIDNSTVISELDTTSIDPIEIQERLPTSEISEAEIIDDSAMELGVSAVKTITVQSDSDEIIHLDLEGKIYTSLVFRWDNGNLFVGTKSDQINQIFQTEDGVAPSRNYVSEIHPNMGESIYLQTDIPTSVSIDLLQYQESRKPQIITISPDEIVNKDSGAKFSTLPIISRDQWGAGTYIWDPYSNSDVDDPSRFTWNPGYYRASRIVIHHTASSINIVDPGQAMRDIYLYHAYSRGWGDVGYNYLIDQEGNIFEGKAGGDEVFGYHAFTEANTMSVGISLIGNFDIDSPTPAQNDALAKLIAEKSLFYDFDLNVSNGSLNDWLNEDKTIFGHKDAWFWCHSSHSQSYRCSTQDQWVVNATACPGLNFHSTIGTQIIAAANSYRNSGFESIKSIVAEVDEKLSNAPPNINTFIVTFDEPADVSRSIIEAKIPNHSGILKYEILRNSAILTVGDWNDGILVPTSGWTGHTAGRFFPASEGEKDRVRTLMKIFALDEDVRSVDLNRSYRISPIE